LKRIIFTSGAAIFMALIALNSNLTAGKNSGTSAYSFLRVGVGARGQAMGGAMVGLANDEYAGYYNPAGLGLLAPITEVENEFGEVQEVEGEISKYFAASYNNYITDIQSGYVAFIMRSGLGGMIGCSLDYLNYGTFDETDANNIKTGTFSASDMAFALNFGQRVDENFYWGVSGKFIYQKLQDYSSDGLAIDGGVIYRLRDKRTQFGVAAKNIGAQLKGLTSQHKDKLPASVQAGISHNLKGAPLLFSTQVDFPFDHDLSLKVGLEMSGLDPFLLRMGWDSAGRDYKSGSSRDKWGGFSGGFGYGWKNYQIDYSYSSFADLGSSHRVSLSGSF